MSNLTEEGVTDVKTKACDALLSRRVESKMRGKKVGDVLNRLSIAEPKPRDGKARELSIPPSVLAARAAAAAAAAGAASSSAMRDGDEDLDDDDQRMDGGGAGSSAASNGAGAAMVRKWLERDRERAGECLCRCCRFAGRIAHANCHNARSIAVCSIPSSFVCCVFASFMSAGGGPGVYRPDTTKYYILRDGGAYAYACVPPACDFRWKDGWYGLARPPRGRRVLCCFSLCVFDVVSHFAA